MFGWGQFAPRTKTTPGGSATPPPAPPPPGVPEAATGRDPAPSGGAQGGLLQRGPCEYCGRDWVSHVPYFAHCPYADPITAVFDAVARHAEQGYPAGGPTL